MTYGHILTNKEIDKETKFFVFEGPYQIEIIGKVVMKQGQCKVVTDSVWYDKIHLQYFQRGRNAGGFYRPFIPPSKPPKTVANKIYRL